MKPDIHDRPDISLLYVEDDPYVRVLIARILAERYPGSTIHTAEDGMAGLELYRKHKPDLVLADIRMPIMDGIMMAQEIRTLNAKAEIIFITANSDTQSLLDAIRIGISRYLLKPIDHRLLFEAVEECFGRLSLERQVKKQNEYIRRLSRAIEQSPSVVVITDVQGSIEYVNPKFTELTGYMFEEAVGQNARILKTDETSPEQFEQLWTNIAAGREWRGEFVNRKKNGELYHEAASISPLLNEEGNITHFIGVKEDITERKRHEQEIEMLNTGLAHRAAELEDLNKDLDLFSLAVSHDLRSPLTGIHTSCQVLQELYADKLDVQGNKFIRYIRQETVRMDKLIDTLLNFFRLNKQGFESREIDLSLMAHKIVQELQRGEPQRRVKFGIQEKVKGNGDHDLLRLVLSNLMGNAWKFTGGKEPAQVEFGMTEIEGKQTYFVRDNGVGFDGRQAGKIFDAFQRLHGQHEFEGHGIGLAVVQRIIKRHGGQVWAEGETGKGATIFFTL